MSRLLSIRRLSVVFFSLFAVLVAGVLVFQREWIGPGERCEADGGWYDIETRVCAQPIYIPSITGRAPGESRAQASDTGNREILGLERQAAQQRRAVVDAIEAERAAR